VLKWARENDCPWDVDTCLALGGKLEVLVGVGAGARVPVGYAHVCGACAAQSGCLEVMKWLRENDCPWDWTTCA